MEAFRDSEIKRLVRELSEAWTGYSEDGFVEQILNVPRPTNPSSSSQDEGIGAAPSGLNDGDLALSLISASALRQAFPGESGADSSLGRELAQRTR